MDNFQKDVSFDFFKKNKKINDEENHIKSINNNNKKNNIMITLIISAMLFILLQFHFAFEKMDSLKEHFYEINAANDKIANTFNLKNNQIDIDNFVKYSHVPFLEVEEFTSKFVLDIINNDKVSLKAKNKLLAAYEKNGYYGFIYDCYYQQKCNLIDLTCHFMFKKIETKLELISLNSLNSNNNLINNYKLSHQKN